MKLSLKLLALGFAVSMFAACSSTDTTPEVEEVPAAVEEQSNAEGGNQRGSRQGSGGQRGQRQGGGNNNQEAVVELNNVFYFDFDKSTLTTQTRADLDTYAAVLVAAPRDIRLEGHADERGTREYNIALGERRAKSVADYLIAAGVSARNIEVVSYGEERPEVDGSTSAAWQANRRVELY